MPAAILLICRSCHGSQQPVPEQPADCAALCNRIQHLHQTWLRQLELEIRGVDCLWTCGHPCTIALVAEGKPTYVVANVVIIQDGNLNGVAEAALHLSERYLASSCGIIPWQQFPGIFQTEFVVRIPSATSSKPDDPN